MRPKRYRAYLVRDGKDERETTVLAPVMVLQIMGRTFTRQSIGGKDPLEEWSERDEYKRHGRRGDGWVYVWSRTEEIRLQ